MTPEALTALKASIAKWERNAEAKTPDEYRTRVADCPLCDMFFYEKSCAGCPVFKKTGQQLCRGTPYEAAADRRTDWLFDLEDEVRRDAAHARARDEVAFLKSLLPEGETA